MLFHASVEAAEPRRVATAIAEIWGGRAFPLPFLAEGAWAALTGDEHGTLLEVMPRGTEFHRAPGRHLEVRQGNGVGTSGFHLLSGSPFGVDRVIEIARAHGFEAHLADHAGLPVIEVWLDEVLFEVITPEVQAAYRTMVTLENAEALALQHFGPGALAA